MAVTTAGEGQRPDVPSGSVKRVATAIGEGAMAVRLVLDYVG
jgi:hypothetical protein